MLAAEAHDARQFVGTAVANARPSQPDKTV